MYQKIIFNTLRNVYTWVENHILVIEDETVEPSCQVRLWRYKCINAEALF